jgi:acetyl-CoA carboxylase biotin carboxyl carrier protein
MRASASQRRPDRSGHPGRGALSGLAELSGLPGPQWPITEPAAPVPAATGPAETGPPGTGPTDTRQPGAGSPAEVLDALCASAQRLLGAAERPPARLRLAAAGASVELEWPLPGAVTPAASAAPAAVTAVTASMPSAAVAAGPDGRAAAGGDGSAAAQPGEVTAAAVATAAPATAAGPGAAGTAPSAQAAQLCIRAPMVGTFYHAPEPGSAPFVRPGDVVEAGQQVGILEVMKLMTPVEADRRTRVVEFLVPDAAAVEHGQPLISCAAA